MSNLTEKLNSIEEQLSSQHSQVLSRLETIIQEIPSRLDTIIEKLDLLNTTLSNNVPVLDATPIVDAINNLRGTEPHNTLLSINETLWDIRGSEPGMSLLVLRDAINNMRGVGPENSLRSINESLWNLAGPAPGTNLTQLADAIVALGGGSNLKALFELWNPGAGITPYNMLDAIYITLTSSGVTQSAANAILMRLIAQFDESVVAPTMKDLLMTISAQQAQLVSLGANPLDVVPTGICESPFVSVGTFVNPISAALASPVTVATWDFSTTADFTEGALGLPGSIFPTNEGADWSQYRVYVASSASLFSAQLGGNDRWPTNEWVVLPIVASAFFSVDHEGEALRVYICGAGDGGVDPPPNPNAIQNADLGTCGATATFSARITAYTIADTFSSGGVDYNVYKPIFPDVAGLIKKIGLQGVVQADPAWFALHPGNSSWIHFCVSWNFAGNTMWPTWGRMLADSAGEAALPFYDWQLLTAGSAYNDELQPTAIATVGRGEYISYSFAAPASLGMPSNVFVHVRGVAAS
jgi:hypothetical protein